MKENSTSRQLNSRGYICNDFCVQAHDVLQSSELIQSFMTFFLSRQSVSPRLNLSVLQSPSRVLNDRVSKRFTEVFKTCSFTQRRKKTWMQRSEPFSKIKGFLFSPLLVRRLVSCAWTQAGSQALLRGQITALYLSFPMKVWKWQLFSEGTRVCAV